MTKKILIITPRSPFQNRGADEQDRYSGIKWFITNGFDVRVITKTLNGDLSQIEISKKELGIQIIPVSYKYQKSKSLKQIIKRLINPLFWDGAAFEYFDKEIQDATKEEIQEFRPDLVWFDYSYLWPLYKIVKKFDIPIVTRSINFEPRHMFEEEGVSLITIIKYLPKLLSEYFTAQQSDIIAALNPNEAIKYRKLGAKNVKLLPLRYLWELPQSYVVKNTTPIHVLFMGSSYLVDHNKKALEFILQKVSIKTFEKYPNKFIFHISGSKFPNEYLKFVDGRNIIREDYIPQEKMEEFLQKMDVIISPSSKVVGMQGKVFEPLYRGFPLITSEQNIVGYPFVNRESIFLIKKEDDYINFLNDLLDSRLRSGVSDNAKKISFKLFSKSPESNVMEEILREFSK